MHLWNHTLGSRDIACWRTEQGILVVGLMPAPVNLFWVLTPSRSLCFAPHTVSHRLTLCNPQIAAWKPCKKTCKFLFLFQQGIPQPLTVSSQVHVGPKSSLSSLLLFWGNTLAHWQTAFQMFRWHFLINLNKFSKKVTENSQNISFQYWVQSESACHCCCHFSETHTLSWISINHILLWVIFERTYNI